MLTYKKLTCLNGGNSLVNSISRRYSNQPLPAVSSKNTGTGSVIGISKKPCRPPFMKNTFLGIFDLEMLLYPELDKSTLQSLKKNIEPYKEYFKNIDTKNISSCGSISKDITDNLKNLGLFGQVVPQKYGGRGQTATETAYINEIIGKDLDIALTLYSHNFLGTQTISIYGSEDQKSKYLPLLSSGDCIAAYCMTEVGTGSDLSAFSTSLTPFEDDKNKYLLNGQKHWVINGKNANFFIVVAKESVKTYTGTYAPSFKIVLVEKNSPGVIISEPKEHIGLNASNVCDVHFDNTPVNEESIIIGGGNQAFEMNVNILNNGRYNIGAITVSILKELLKKAVDFIVTREQTLKPLVDCENIQEKCSYIATRIYALESMTYHTAALLDNYENPDCLMELAIIKVFSFTEGRRCLDIVLELLGGRALLNSEITQKYFRDFRSMEVFDGTTDFTNLFISLIGLQHAGITMNENVAKMRFPFEHPGFILKRMFASRKQNKDNPKLTIGIYEQLHPSLIESSNQLEYCVLRLDYAVGIFFQRYGPDVVHQQIDLMRLANAAVKIYAMTTVLGRSSRSYCIGLPNADTEIKYAVKICEDYKKIVQTELNDLINGLLVSGDVFSLQFGPDIFRHHGYFCEHPLERSY